MIYGDRVFQIKLNDPMYGNLVQIAPVMETPDKLIISVPDGEGGWEELEFDKAKLLPNDLPVLSMPRRWAEKLYEALGELFEPKGPDATTQQLEATKYHLEDLRKLIPKLGG